MGPVFNILPRDLASGIDAFRQKGLYVKSIGVYNLELTLIWTLEKWPRLWRSPKSWTTSDVVARKRNRPGEVAEWLKAHPC